MKKIKIELKYIMIVLVVIAGVLLAISGNFSETKTMTAYKTTVDGSDSARVAKWDIVGLTRNGAENLNLNVGFQEEVTEAGCWYFDISNFSEVSAAISSASTIKFRLIHDNFNSASAKPNVTWNFLEGTVNPIKFTITAYPGSATSMLKYTKDDSTLNYEAYYNLSAGDKTGYQEVFTPSGEGIVVATTETTPVFTLQNESQDGQTVYFYECEFKLSDALNGVSATLIEKVCSLGMGTTKSDTTFKVEWSVGTVAEHVCVDANNDYKCDINSEHHVCKDTDSDGECNGCNQPMANQYYKYIISETNGAIEGYELYNSSSSTYYDKGVQRYIFKSKSPVDFFDYQKYTSTLGGEPMYQLPNQSGTQTILVPHSTVINDDVYKNTVEGYKTVGTNLDVRQAWEKLTYDQYNRFKDDYAEVESSLSYMAYGVKLQIIFDLSVEQVD